MASGQDCKGVLIISLDVFKEVLRANSVGKIYIYSDSYNMIMSLKFCGVINFTYCYPVIA